MSRGGVICLLHVLGSLMFSLNAQEPLSVDSTTSVNRKVDAANDRVVKSDTIVPLIETEAIVLDKSALAFGEAEFKPNSTKAVLLSAIFPGLGQAYNRKYWKLPIIYGGALGIVYAITWNGRVYGDYKNAYRDAVLNVQNGAYMDFLQPGDDLNNNIYGGKEKLQDALRRKKDFFRRNRDLAIIVAVGVYALCMVDAYVDAQLYDFEVSPDLSMRVMPVVWGPSPGSKISVGVQCNIVF
ncbi:DUF5683 domain-containing protein [Dysgonomonas sp. Marseille-P4361]|uniref:DUF5683 domain-containing protein n=1 Tax=Dysgonomonas sp. Marseille-P4361 TaxID=2161820 RepID=UPI000D55C6F8|nr:DUF5683 domain-containing protein [Dysgonomonas sp. Marseille-P4361]